MRTKIKYLVVAALMYAVQSCESKNVSVESTDVVVNGREINTYIIDSCEYIGEIRDYNTDILTHKGNCKFCEERREVSKGLTNQ
jgi:hypothetical protein